MADETSNSLPGKENGGVILFAANFFKHPGMVGWLFPSSRFLVNQVLSEIDWARARTVVEYGPGVGTFTREILQRMRTDAHLVAFEINNDFNRYLRESFSDPRLHVVNRSAAEVDAALEGLGLGPVDYVISGIPFKTLPHNLRELIVRKTYSVLRPEGRFLVYQVSRAVLPYLESVFGTVSRQIQLLNYIPARVFSCARPVPAE